MASVVEGAFFMEATDSSEEDDGYPQGPTNSQMSQNFGAFAARMQNLGYREQSGMLSEAASQTSFNQGRFCKAADTIWISLQQVWYFIPTQTEISGGC